MQKTLKALYSLGFLTWHKMAQVKRKVMYMCTHTHAKKLAAMEIHLCHLCQLCQPVCHNHCEIRITQVTSAS